MTSLTFTGTNWNAPQNVTVTGVDDTVADGNQPFRIIFTDTTSMDVTYAAITPSTGTTAVWLALSLLGYLGLVQGEEQNEATRLGNRHRAERVVRQSDPRGNPIYWIGPAGAESDSGPGTDFHAVASKRVSVTPIQTDVTRFAALDQIAGWVRGL